MRFHPLASSFVDGDFIAKTFGLTPVPSRLPELGRQGVRLSRECELSNLTGRPDKGAAKFLRKNRDKAIGHAASGHFGVVWYDGELFWEEVMVLKATVDHISDKSLKSLFQRVNDKWGWE